MQFRRTLPTKTASLFLAGAMVLAAPVAGAGITAAGHSTAEAAAANGVSAKQSKSRAKANYTSVQKQFNKARKQADIAKSALKKAKLALEIAGKDLVAKKSTVESARKMADTAKEAYEAAEKAPVKYSSLDYFKAAGSRKAVNALVNSRYASFTDFTKRGDATNVAMVRKSLDYLDQFNELRSSIGLSQLKVTDYMMATAEADVNWSRTHIQHARQFNVGENLAWNYDDPFKGWYDAEKALYDKGDRTFSEIGHYLNIVDRDYRITGFATALGGEYGGYTTGQTFHYEDSDSQAYTVAQWRERFETWVSSMGDDGQGAIDAAEENYTKAEAAYDRAESAYDKAQSVQESATRVLKDARYDYDSAASDLAFARKNLSRSKKTYAKLGGNVATAVKSGDAKVPVVNVANVSGVFVNKTVAGETATSLVLGPKVKTISESALSGQKQIRTLEVNTNKLTVASVKGSLQGSGITKVRVRVFSSKRKNASWVKKYKKVFAKKVVGKRVNVVG